MARGYSDLTGERLQHALQSLADLLREVPTDWVSVPEGFPGGASLETLDVRARTGATVLAVERDGEAHPGPPVGFAIQAGDRLLVFGPGEAAERLRALLEQAREVPSP